MLSSDEAFCVIIEYASYFRSYLGAEIFKFLDLLKAMQLTPELYQEEVDLWKQAVQRAVSGERRVNDLKLYENRYGRNELYLGEGFLAENKAQEASKLFLKNVRENTKDEFEEHGVGLGAILTFISGEGELDDYSWRRSSVKVTGKPFSLDNKIYPDQVFSIMYEVLSKYQNKYGFELCGVLRLLRSMREEPAEHEEEWKLWRNAWERARSGECLGWIDYIYVEKES